MLQDHEHVFGDISETDEHQSYLMEASLSGKSDVTNWVFGIAHQSDSYSSEAFPGFDYTYTASSFYLWCLIRLSALIRPASLGP